MLYMKRVKIKLPYKNNQLTVQQRSMNFSIKEEIASILALQYPLYCAFVAGKEV